MIVWCDHASDRSEVFGLEVEVFQWLNFTPDNQQVQAERFSFLRERVRTVSVPGSCSNLAKVRVMKREGSSSKDKQKEKELC